MNDHYYDMIVSYLPLYVNIILHSGSTCFRYCVCRVIDETEKYEYYQRVVSCYS